MCDKKITVLEYYYNIGKGNTCYATNSQNISTYVIRLSSVSEINYIYGIVNFFQTFINMNC